MIVQCDSCNSRYRIAEDKILPQGIKVRCAKCKNVFVVKPARSESAPSPAPEHPLPDTTASPPAPQQTLPDKAVPSSEPPPASEPPAASVPPTSAAEAEKATEPAKAEAKPSPEPDTPAQPPVEKPKTEPPAQGHYDDSDIDEALSMLIGEPGEEDFVPSTPKFDSGTSGPTGEETAAAQAPPTPAGQNEGTSATPSLPETPEPGPEPSPPHSPADEQELPALQGLGSTPEKEGPAPPLDTATRQGAGRQDADSLDWGNISLDQAGPAEQAADTMNIKIPPPELPGDDPDEEGQQEDEPASYVEPSTKTRAKVDTKSSPPPRKSSRGLRLSLLLVLLLAAGYYFYPSIRAYIPSRSAETVESMAVENITVGTLKRGDGVILATIRGRVKNGYSTNKGMIKVRAIFKDSGGKELAKVDSFCGNLFTDVELGNLELAEIRSAMGNELGQSLSNSSISPGATIPFLIVMENPPLESKEVTVKVLEFADTP